VTRESPGARYFLQHPKPKLVLNENPFHQTSFVILNEVEGPHACLLRSKHNENFQPTSDQQKAQLRLKVRFEVMCFYAALRSRFRRKQQRRRS
jgi:hypothetical protein